MTDLFGWGTPVEIERRRRIRLCVWAYAYELLNVSLVSDATFDAECIASQPHIRTGRLDDWWQREFAPHTGSWILTHPELTSIATLAKQMLHKMETTDE